MTVKIKFIPTSTVKAIAEGCEPFVRQRSRIGLIGRIDPSCSMIDGQTVKTRTIYNLLVETYGSPNVITVDTLNYKSEPLRVMKELVHCMRGCDDIMVLLSGGGRKALFPVLSWAAQHHGKHIYHNLIGGHIADDVESDASGKIGDYLRSFEVNWVESRELARRLHSMGVSNVEYLPNFKILPKIEPFDEYQLKGPFKFVTFSRVQPEKGVELAAEVVAAINHDAGKTVATLDIYGPIKEDYKDHFEALVTSTPNVEYRGCINAEESVWALMGYTCLLFPTSWPGEGIPGTIIDAMSSGLPIIASRWSCYDEMLEDGLTGFSYAYDRPQDLRHTVEIFMRLDDQALLKLKNESLSRARSYSAEKVFSTVVQRIESTRGGVKL